MIHSTAVTADANTFTEPGSEQALASARVFVDLIRKLELGFDRRGGTVPEPAEREATRETYWKLVRDIATALAHSPIETARDLIEELRCTVGPSVWRSRFDRHSILRAAWSPTGVS